MTSLLSRRILVTGSSRGVGLDAAKLFLRAGASVVLNSRDTDDLRGLCASLALGERVRGLAFDVTDEDGVVAAVEWACTTWGGIDTLVHAVPARVVVDPGASTQDSFEQGLRTLLSGTLNTARAAQSAGIPRVVVLLPAEDGFARKALLDLVASLACAGPATRVFAAGEDELEAAISRGHVCA